MDRSYIDLSIHLSQRRQWHPTPLLLPGKSHGWRGLQSMGSLGIGQDSATSLSLFTFMHWRRKWQPTPVFLPGASQGQQSLVGCRLWGRTESDTTEGTQQQQQQQQQAFSSCGERGLLTAVAPLLWSTGSRCAGSVVAALGLLCSGVRGIFPDQGWNSLA